MSGHRRVADNAYETEWAKLNEYEQCMFELWLAGLMPKHFYDMRCREINEAFDALEAKRLNAHKRAA